MNPVFSRWLGHYVLFLVLGLSFVVQGNPIPPTSTSFSPGIPTKVEGGLPSSTSSAMTTTLSSSTSASTTTMTSTTSSDTSATKVSTSRTEKSTSSTSSAIIPASSTSETASETKITTKSTTESIASLTTSASVTQSTTSPTPSSITSSPSTSASSSSTTDNRTLKIALSVTFSILGTIALILCTILILQCTRTSPQYQRFRLRFFPFNQGRGGPTPLSENEIASWREKPLSPPATAYANLIQRYSRPLSLNRPLSSNPVLLLHQTSQNRRSINQGYSRFGSPENSLTRPAVPPKLILTGGGERTVIRSFSSVVARENGISFTSRGGSRSDRFTGGHGTSKRSATSPLPPIARAPNSRPGLTDESLPGTPAFILPTHPRRVSRKLSKIHLSPQSPSTPRPSTAASALTFGGGKRRRRSMPGLNRRFHGEEGEGWRCEEDQVVQRGCSGSEGVVHGRSRSDMTPFKEAMEGRIGVGGAGGVRPSFEGVKEEAPG